MVDGITNSFDVWINAQGLKSKGRVKGVDNISFPGLTKLRELILDLAVRGKLVHHDKDEESAIIQLARIQKDRGLNLSINDITNRTNDFPAFNLPQGWAIAFIPEIVQNKKYAIKRGPFGSSLRKDFFVPKGYKVYEQQHAINDNFFIGNYFIDESKFIELKAFEVKPKDIIISCSGTVGKVAIAPKEIEPGIINQALLKLSINEDILLNDYFKILFPAYYMNTETLSELQGTAQKNMVSVKTLKSEPFLLPPREEQLRIIAKVDELMALCDKLENEQSKNLKTHQLLVETLLDTLTQAKDAEELQEAWKRLESHFDTLFVTEESVVKLKQTILQLAVMGKLVPQDPNDEPASVLLEKIGKEKEKLIKAGKIKKQKPLPEISEEEKAFEVPKGWQWVKWEEILDFDDAPFKRGPFGSALKKDMFVDSGYKVYEQYCPINDDCSFERYYITEEKYKTMEAFAVKANDYLISCSGVTLGRITQVPDDFQEGIINQALLRVRINHNYIDKEFFKFLFRSPYFQKQIFDNSTGSAIPNVKGVKDLKAMPVPFLSIFEQRRIVNKLKELNKYCDFLKERINKAQEIQVVLAEAVVERAVG